MTTKKHKFLSDFPEAYKLLVYRLEALEGLRDHTVERVEHYEKHGGITPATKELLPGWVMNIGMIRSGLPPDVLASYDLMMGKRRAWQEKLKRVIDEME